MSEHRRFDLGDGAWTTYDPAFLSSEEADGLLADLLDTEPWAHRPIVVFGREVAQPRLMSWAGAIPYRYSGQTLEPRPMPERVATLNARVAEVVGVPFNHVVLNLYRDGRDRIGLHADDEAELGREPTIAALSLGAERRFVLAPKDKRQRKRKKSFVLAHGSLLVMGGTIQHRWRHGVPGETGVSAPRINITFRWLKGPPGWRPPERRRPPPA